MSNDELEEIRQKKLNALKERAAQDQAREEQMAEAEAKKQAIIRQILTPKARERLSNIKLVKPQFAEQIEMQLIQIASSGRLKGRIDDEKLKSLLKQLQGKGRERKIKFR